LALAAGLVTRGFSIANAQDKVWKHGILEIQSDSGLIAEVDKGGFAAKRELKIELVQIKAGTTLMKALIAGEIPRRSCDRRQRGQTQGWNATTCLWLVKRRPAYRASAAGYLSGNGTPDRDRAGPFGAGSAAQMSR
jgi:hypothetical protein